MTQFEVWYDQGNYISLQIDVAQDLIYITSRSIYSKQLTH